MSTLAKIAASYGIAPGELANLVGMGQVEIHAELTGEQLAFVVNSADRSDFFGRPAGGRHRFR